MKIYKCIFETADAKYRTYSFYRTKLSFNLWDIVKLTRRECSEKEKRGENKWLVTDIIRIK